MKKIWFILCMLLPFSAMAAELDLKDGWVRLMPPVADSTAAYLTLENHGNAAVTIVGVSSEAAGTAMLHGMSMKDGRMRMFELKSLEVPAHGKLALQPGGSHVMLMGLKKPLVEGQSVNLTLSYADGSSQSFGLKVVDARGSSMGTTMGGRMQHGGH